MEKTTKPIMEGGILAGIAIVMAMLGVYLPLLGIAFIYTWSVPLIVLAVRHDFKWSVLTAVVITILTVICNLIGDIISGILDPRIRLE